MRVSTQLSESKIEEIRKDFSFFDRDGNGSVGFEEFQEMWKFVAPVSTPTAGGAAAAPAPAPAPAESASTPSGVDRARFDRFDKDKTGQLEKEEVQAMMQDMGFECDEAYLGAGHSPMIRR